VVAPIARELPALAAGGALPAPGGSARRPEAGQIDILLLRKVEGELSAGARQILAGLAEHLNDYTLIELKSASDTLRGGDFATFLAYALLYRAQNEPALVPGRLTLIVIAPRLTRPHRQELNLLGAAFQEDQPGIWRLGGAGILGHPAWLLETEFLVGSAHPILTLLSPRFLRQGQQTYEELHQAGYTELVVYMAQQIQQFQMKGMEFAMQHLHTEDEMAQAVRDLLASWPPEQRLAGLSPEQRLAGLSPEELAETVRELFASFPPEERLAGLAPEQRLAGLSPEERLAGLSPEQRLAGLSPEEREQLKDLLQRQPRTNGSAPPG
jgi:hypothetical protein